MAWVLFSNAFDRRLKGPGNPSCCRRNAALNISGAIPRGGLLGAEDSVNAPREAILRYDTVESRHLTVLVGVGYRS